MRPPRFHSATPSTDTGEADVLPPYTVRTSKRARRVQLRVLPHGTVEAVVPRGFDPRALDTFVARHRSWIAKRLAHIDEQRRRRPHLFETPPSRIELRALGREWSVDYRWGTARPAARRGTHDTLEVRAGDTDAACTLLQRWLMRRAKEHLVPWLRETSAELGLEINRVSVRAQKSRWGSCSAQGNISLNRNLLFLPPEGVRYLFVHELCHTRHMNHSRRFWSLVARLDPHFERHEALLRRAHDYVPLWALPD
ncbi:MAG: SprT family zinc-dependent metalloprotease [Gammaproteobacteria bacterium]